MVTIAPQDSEQYIMIDDCCLKQTVKKGANFLIRRPLTDLEALLLCIYYFIFTMMICVFIIKYRLTALWFEWTVGDCISPTLVLHLNIFVNITVVVQMVENTKDLVYTFMCKCDYRQHPELEERSD
jgi:hypothetical protein